MIYEIKSMYLIVQFFCEVLQAKLHTNVIDARKTIDSKDPNTGGTLLEPQPIGGNNYFRKLVENLAKRYKRAPAEHPQEYAYPPGYGYGYRPYPPTFDDYMLENKKRAKTLEKYQSMSYLNGNKLLQMVTTVLSDFFGASTIGQYNGYKPLNTTITSPVIWLGNKIASVAWTTTEMPVWRPPQWSPAVWQRHRR